MKLGENMRWSLHDGYFNEDEIKDPRIIIKTHEVFSFILATEQISELISLIVRKNTEKNMNTQYEKMDLFVKNIQIKLDTLAPGQKLDRDALATELAILDTEFGKAGFKMLIALVVQTRSDFKVSRGRTGGTVKL
jgi:hypothetical protein